MRKSSLVSMVLGVFLSTSSVYAEIPKHPLIDQARKQRGLRVEYALKNGVQVGLTSDGKSYYVLWLPKGSAPKDPPPMLVSMHGHGGYAFEDFYVWHRYLEKRGYGLLAVQWWLGKGERTEDYLLPHEVYRVIDDVMKKMRIKPQTALLHGFSRGSANIYPVAAMDRSLHNNYFKLFIANAGRANSGYPPVGEIENGRYGDKPFAGTHWVTFAGGKDTNSQRDGLQGMRETGEWLEKYGGTVDLAIEDPDGGHGGFHMSPKNCNAALDVFDALKAQ